jgi:hypothetical protein
MDQETATSFNYLSIALDDDKQAEEAEEVSDKATLRKKRIAAAVERSKAEYQAVHAYTERGVSDAGAWPSLMTE